MKCGEIGSLPGGLDVESIDEMVGHHQPFPLLFLQHLVFFEDNLVLKLGDFPQDVPLVGVVFGGLTQLAGNVFCFFNRLLAAILETFVGGGLVEAVECAHYHGVDIRLGEVPEFFRRLGGPA